MYWLIVYKTYSRFGGTLHTFEVHDKNKEAALVEARKILKRMSLDNAEARIVFFTESRSIEENLLLFRNLKKVQEHL